MFGRPWVRFTVALVLGVFALQAKATLINFGELGNGSAASLDAGFGVTVTGSADVYFSDTYSNSANGGLGVGSGSISSQSLDAGETLTIDFGQLVNSVLLTTHDIPPFGNVFYEINAFLGLTDLGVFAVPVHAANIETKNISALVGSPFDLIAVRVTASPPLGLVIEQLEFEPVDPPGPVPAPGSLGLLVLGLLALTRRLGIA